MENFEIIKKKIKDHVNNINLEQFKEEIKNYCPEIYREEIIKMEENYSQLTLFKPTEFPLRLNAYLACALTGLDKDKRDLVFSLSDIVAGICSSNNIDLYEPRKKTDPVYNKELKDSEVFATDRQRVLESDLLIHLSLYPSTGSGEEIEFANNALLPVIIISRKDDSVSRMITGIPGFKIHLKYSEPEELRAILNDTLTRIRPILEERKLAYSQYEINLVGNRVRTLREELALTREELVENIPNLTIEMLEQLEISIDKISNPSLLLLRQIATILKTTVADIIEPNISGYVISTLQDWIEGKQAARYDDLKIKDRNKILRRILLRIIDSLEKD